jgi:hypothetical protein
MSAASLTSARVSPALVGRGLGVAQHTLHQGTSRAVVRKRGGGEDLLELVEPLARLREALDVATCETGTELERILARDHGQALGHHLGQGGVVALAFEQMLELGGNLEVAGEGLEQREQVAGSAGRVARVARHRGRVTQQAVTTRPVGEPIEHAVVGGEQLVPLLAHRAQDGQSFQGPVRRGGELEDALEQVDDDRRLPGVPLLVETQGALAEHSDLLGLHVGVERGPVCGGGFVGFLRIGRRGLKLVPSLLVGWVGRDFLERGLELVGRSLF